MFFWHTPGNFRQVVLCTEHTTVLLWTRAKFAFPSTTVIYRGVFLYHIHPTITEPMAKTVVRAQVGYHPTYVSLVLLGITGKNIHVDHVLARVKFAHFHFF